MDILKRIYPITICLALTSCYEDFVPTIDCDPVLCLNALITAGEHIDVDVTHTWRFDQSNENTNNTVDYAEIKIYANGKLQDADYKPNEGDTINIMVDSPTYGHAEAKVVIPISIPPKSFTCKPILTNIWQTEVPDYYAVASIGFDIYAEIEIDDQPNKADYYQFFYNSIQKETTTDNDDYVSSVLHPFNLNVGMLQYKSEPLFSEHIGIFESILGVDTDGFAFFTDRQFSDNTYTLHIQIDNNKLDISASEDEYKSNIEDMGIEFTLSTISESYYSWLNYQWQIDNNIIGDISDLGFGDPIYGYSNVSTGAGVVAARSKVSYTFPLKDFINGTLFPDVAE